MLHITRLLIVAMFATLVTPPAFAGKSGGSSARASTFKSGSTYRPARSSTQRVGSLGAKQPPRSLIEPSGPQPSPRVAEIIRERERSGPGWLGTAFLVYLLSNHDLSSSDKSWINGRISTLRAEGVEEGDAPLLLPADPSVKFTFTGVREVLHVGQTATIRVEAMDHRGDVRKPISVTCEAPAGGHATARGAVSTIVWTPTDVGSTLIVCKAGARQERRLLRVAE